jgi:DNA-binding NarL/FixJ family response regulator
MNIDTQRDRVALVVDDHDAVRRALCDRIQASFSGCRLRQAGSVDEALKVVDAEKVDIILMDFRLPGTDGVDGTRLVLERSPQTRVVMVSAYDDLSHRLAARKAGAMGFVAKRAIGRELIPLMQELMNARH